LNVHGTSLNVAQKARIHNGAASAALGATLGLIAHEFGLTEVIPTGSFVVWILVWAAIGVALSAAGWFRQLSWAVVAAFILLLVILETPLSGALASRWVRDDSRSTSTGVDAVIVLSSSVKSDSLLDGQGTERLLTGVEVLRSMHAPRLAVTRIPPSGRAGPSSDPGQRRLFQLTGVDSAIVIDSVYSTRDEAVKAARVLGSSVHRVALVTSPLHTRRACATFEGAGFDVVCIPAREIAHVLRNPANDEDRLAAFRAYLYERLGMVKYRWKGWIH
jgi:uncharacterized SAM-binding protein YcdF (DUF218 family)